MKNIISRIKILFWEIQSFVIGVMIYIFGTRLTCDVKQGSNGRWRYVVYDGQNCVAVCTPQGYHTKEEAVTNLSILINSRAKVLFPSRLKRD